MSVRAAASRASACLGWACSAPPRWNACDSLAFRAGWNCKPRTLDGIGCYAGTKALTAFLARTDVLVCLLPLTEATRGLLNAKLFAALPRGASLMNVGRGRI